MEGETVTCKDVTFRLSTSLPILEGCLTASCDKWENGKSISLIDTGHANIEYGAKTYSDLARLPGGDHPVTQQASPGAPLGAQRSLGNRWRGTSTRVTVTRSEASHRPRMWLPGRLGNQGGAGRRRTEPSRRRTGAGGPGVDPGRLRLSGVLAEHSLIG